MEKIDYQNMAKAIYAKFLNIGDYEHNPLSMNVTDQLQDLLTDVKSVDDLEEEIKEVIARIIRLDLRFRRIRSINYRVFAPSGNSGWVVRFRIFH